MSPADYEAWLQLAEAIRELDEWRTGKRLVFWRVRWTYGQTGNCRTFRNFPSKRAAWRNARACGGRVYRVTVRTVKKAKR